MATRFLPIWKTLKFLLKASGLTHKLVFCYLGLQQSAIPLMVAI